MALKAPRGTRDILPEDITVWRWVEDTCRRVFARYGFEEIRTPVFEETPLFVRSIGEVTDIVEKEMYTFAAGGDSSVTLRPEGTAPVVRAFVQHSLGKKKTLHKLFYTGPMFRYERPQAGRSRQFHQIGVEVFGSSDPLVDAECIIMANEIFSELGLDDVITKINSIGTNQSRDAYRDVLKQELAARKDKLCPDCTKRYDRNVFRILDCKVRECRAVCDSLPPILDYLSEEDADAFTRVTGALEKAGVNIEIDKHLVRGFDYYTNTVYEFTCPRLGARDAVGGGGRYDGLVEGLGGPATPATGFALGQDVMILALGDGVHARTSSNLDVYIVDAFRGGEPRVFEILQMLRGARLRADKDYEGRSVKAQMRTANKLAVPVVLVIGEDELANNTVTLKDMSEGSQANVALENLIATLDTKRGKE